MNYILEHEKKLHLVFRSLDENKDGRFIFIFLYVNEIVKVFFN